MTERFGARLRAAVAVKGPLCAGIDPHPELLADWGLPRTGAGVRRFAQLCVEAFGDLVAVVKPQSAFFEVYGSAGIAALEEAIGAAGEAGALVLLDVKRGDIGSTMGAYAAAYLRDGSPLAVDAVTLSPYLGFDSLRPAVDLACDTGRGVFVLAMTSNKEAASVQLVTGADGRSVGQAMVDEAAACNAGVTPLGSVGVVVGATIGTGLLDLSRLNGPILAPGFGAQGGGVADLDRVYGRQRALALPATSRDLLRHGPDVASLRSKASEIADSVRQK